MITLIWLRQLFACVSSSFSVHFPFPALSSTVISFLLLSGVLLISSACPSQASNNQCQCTNRFMRQDCKLFSWGLRNFFFSWPCLSVIYFLCKQIFHPICVVSCPFFQKSENDYIYTKNKDWIWMLLDYFLQIFFCSVSHTVKSFRVRWSVLVWAEPGYL